MADEVVGRTAPRPGTGLIAWIRSPWGAVTVLTLCSALSVIDRQILNLLVQPIKAELAVTDVQVGLLQGPAFTVLYSLLGIPLGRLVDLTNRRRLVVIGVLVWSFATAAFGLARNYPEMFMARALVAMGEAVLLPAAYSLFADMFDGKRLGRAMSTYVTGAVVGSGGGLIISGALFGFFAGQAPVVVPGFGELSDWRLTFIAVGLPGIIAALAVWAVVVEPPRGGRAARPEDQVKLSFGDVLRDLWRERRFYVPMFLTYICFGVLLTGFLSWAPTYLIRTFSATPSEVGRWFGLIMLGSGLTSPIFFGWTADKLNARWGLLAGPRLFGVMLVIIALGALVAFQGRTLGVGLASIGVLALIMSGPAILGTISLQLATPSTMRGQVTAINALGGALIGQNAGAVLVPALSEHIYGVSTLGPAISTVMFVAGLAAALCCFSIRTPSRVKEA